MKLLLCKECHGIFNLALEEKTCTCGQTRGAYEDDGLYAWYEGEHAIPLGFANGSIRAAIRSQPERDRGKTFNAFVIPKVCSTFVKKDS